MRGVVLVTTAAGWILLLSSSVSAAFWDSLKRNDITPAIKIGQGELTGLFQTSTSGKKFMGFYGIPYAQPPVGDLRFQAPQPARPWDGVRAAQSEGNLCPQPTAGMKPQASVSSATDALKVLASLSGAAKLVARYVMHMSEDCLVLNVYTPLEKLPADRLLPVLFWIHGGGFLLGSGDYLVYGPEHLMDQNVVLVTANYRLGPFGFLASNTSDAPGNAGLKDQRLALQWVQDNIQHFGGDPKQVTIYGNSAGASSVHFHILSPQSKGLFRAAILSSGMASHFWAVHTDVEAEASSRRLAEAMGAGAETVADIRRRVQFLRDAPWKDILAATAKPEDANKSERSLVLAFPWGPVVEAPGDTAFLDRHPYDILVSGDFNTDVPVMVGLNDREGSFVVAKFGDDDLTRLQANPSLLLTPNLFESADANAREALANEVRELYFKGQPFSKETMANLADVYGDEFIAHGVHVGMHWHLKHTKAPVYLYYFTLDAFGVSSFIFGTKSLKGAGHSDDLGYVFKNHLISDVGTSDKEGVARGTARMTSLVANFVCERNPTPAKTELVNVDWSPSTLENPAYLEVGDNLTLKQGTIMQERMQFWDDHVKAILSDPVYDLK